MLVTNSVNGSIRTPAISLRRIQKKRNTFFVFFLQSVHCASPFACALTQFLIGLRRSYIVSEKYTPVSFTLPYLNNSVSISDCMLYCTVLFIFTISSKVASVSTIIFVKLCITALLFGFIWHHNLYLILNILPCKKIIF